MKWIIKMLTSHYARDSISQPLIPSDDNVTTLSNYSREVSKSGYDDVFSSGNEKDGDVVVEEVFENDSPTLFL